MMSVLIEPGHRVVSGLAVAGSIVMDLTGTGTGNQSDRRGGRVGFQGMIPGRDGASGVRLISSNQGDRQLGLLRFSR
jgi:hypothetical protein